LRLIPKHRTRTRLRYHLTSRVRHFDFAPGAPRISRMRFWGW
jgi:hypothetical protein